MEIIENIIKLDSKIELSFEDKIYEAAIWDNKIVIVFQTDIDDGFDNLYCYKFDKTLLWRIKQAPQKIGGTARATYVGVEINNGVCKAVDFFGRRFIVDLNSGKIIDKEIVK